MRQAILIITMLVAMTASATGTDIDIGIKTDIDNRINNDIKNTNNIKTDVSNHNANHNEVSGVNQSYNANQNRNNNVANGGDGGSVSGSGNSSLTMSNRLSSMGGAGGQGGSVGNVTNDGNQVTSTTTVEGDSINFPSNSAFAPPAFTRMDCGSTLGAGYTNSSGSGSLGLPIPRWMSGKIKDCEAERDANWLAEMGMKIAAIEARCATRSMRKRFGGSARKKADQISSCVSYLSVGNYPEPQVIEVTREVIKEVPVEVDCHDHKENEGGYMVYDGETYKNVKRLKRVCDKKEY